MPGNAGLAFMGGDPKQVFLVTGEQGLLGLYGNGVENHAVEETGFEIHEQTNLFRNGEPSTRFTGDDPHMGR